MTTTLFDAMKAKGWSTYDLARAAEVPQSAAHDIVNGQRPHSKHRPAIERALGLGKTELDERIARSLEQIARTLADILVTMQERRS